jgi:hypothetical protein
MKMGSSFRVGNCKFTYVPSCMQRLCSQECKNESWQGLLPIFRYFTLYHHWESPLLRAKKPLNKNVTES